MLVNRLARVAVPLLRLRDRRPRTRADLAAAQGRILAGLVRDLAPLPVGRWAGLGALAGLRGEALITAFRADVAVSEYGDYAPFIARVARGEADVLFPGRAVALAQTSGTTSSSSAGERYIPQSRRLLAHHARGGAAALVRLLADAGTGLLDGKLLMLGGSTDLAPNAHGVPAGDLSGIAVSRIPALLQPLYEPGREIALEADWGRKIARIVARCADADVRLVSGIPSWLTVLFDAVCRARGVARIVDAWPGLRGFIHGGHAIGPFLPALARHLDADTRLIEVYPASEGFIAVGAASWRLGDGAPGDMEVLGDHGIVVEFLPERGDGAAVPGTEAVGPEGLEAGVLYRVLLTTTGGLLRYQIGDLVLGAGPGRLRFAGRIKTRISVFGEHVEGHALADALAAACSDSGAAVAHYHVAPVLPMTGEPRGRHEWWIEFAQAPRDAGAFAALIDRHLQTSVIDYAAHRAGDRQLMAPAVVRVPGGTFHAWMAASGKLGGQHKVPQAWPDRSIADQLAQAATAVGGPP